MSSWMSRAKISRGQLFARFGLLTATDARESYRLEYPCVESRHSNVDEANVWVSHELQQVAE